MKKNSKKLLTLVLVAAMSLTMLAGCGDKSNGTTTADPTPAASTGTEKQTETKTPQATPTPTPTPLPDFGGRVVRIGSYYDMTPNPEDSAIEEALSKRIKFVEENCNCKIEFVNLGGDYESQYVTSVLAGDPIVDIGYCLTRNVLPALIEGGIAYPVSDLGVIDFDAYKWRSDVVNAGTYKGKNYTFLLKDPEIRYGIFWNKTLFDKYGLPNLYDLVDKGEWTWDKFKEIAIAGNKDIDGDGKTDIVGFNARENLEWCYLYSDGAYVCEKTDAGMTIDLSDPKVVEALTALQDFTTTVDYDDDIDWSFEGWDCMIKYFRDGKAMMCLEEYWISYGYLTKADTGMQDDWGWVPFPKGPSATDWSCYGKENGCRILLNGVKDPEVVMKIYDMITDLAETTEDWDDLMEDRLETWADDAQTVKNVSYIYNNKLAVINSINGFSDLNSAVNKLVSAVKNGSLTPQSAIEKYKSEIDAAVADIANHDYEADMRARVKTE